MGTPNTYLIIQASDVQFIDINELVQSPTGIRYSLNGMEALIKWNGGTPASVAPLKNTQGPYTEQEILIIVDNNLWTSD